MRLSKPLILQGSALLVLFLCISVAGCRKSRDKAALQPGQHVQQGLTRQEFYRDVYCKLLGDPLLRDIYFPVYTRLDSVPLLCGEDTYEDGSYQERMRSLRAEQAGLMNIRRRKYVQDGSVQTVWTWRAPEDPACLWERLVSDFSAVSEANREAVVFMCESGLAKLTMNADSYTFTLSPDEPVTQDEAEALSALIRAYSRPDPVHAVRAQDPDGQEILLCFSDPVSVFSFRNLLACLQERNEIERAFVYFDNAGTELSLWISSASGGMFAVPLDLARGRTCILPYSGNTALIRHRLTVASAVLPESLRNHFSAEFSVCPTSKDGQRTFFYKIGGTGYALSLSFLDAEARQGVLRFSMINTK